MCWIRFVCGDNVVSVGCLCDEGLRPDKNWFMLSLKFPRQKIVKGDFLNRDGDFRA
jgi:hypothetical protein